MGDSALQSTMHNHHEYPIIVVNMSNKPGVAVNTLAKSLLNKFKDIAANDPSVSVSIEDLSSNQGESPSWAITAESPGRIKRYLLNELSLPPTEGPKFVDYLVWISRTPVRAVYYLRSRLRETVGIGSVWQKARALVGVLPKIVALTIVLTILVLSYLYLMLFISFAVVNPLRRWRLWMVVLYFLALILLVFVFTWKSSLPPLVVWLSQTTQQLLDLAHEHGPGLTFDLLFPVVATVAITVGVSILAFLIGWVRRAIPKVDAWMFPAHGAIDFAYLLDPLYAATARKAFEERLLEAGNRNETRHLFAICEHSGILLAYEVLSRVCPRKIDKPVHLLTRNLDLAGLSVDRLTDLWLFVEPTDWSRFANTTPPELSWYYYRRRLWLRNESTWKITSTPRGRVPEVQCERIRTSSFKSSYSMLVDRLVALADQT